MGALARRDAGPRRGLGESLYGRAALFVLVGSGAIAGAIIIMAELIVADAQTRILDERIRLARTAGQFLEDRIRSDAERLADAAHMFLEEHHHGQHDDAHYSILFHAIRTGSLEEGAFVLDAQRRPIAGIPDEPKAVFDIAGIDLALAEASRTGEVTLTQLDMVGLKPVLAVVSPVTSREDELVGFAVGMLQPAASDLLRALHQSSSRVEAEVGLIDAQGVFIASTDRKHLFQHSNHEGELGEAIRDGREFRGIHDCHAETDSAPPGQAEVMAFAPLPSLGLGLMIVQPEKIALAPAYTLGRRLIAFGAAIIVLFVAFNVLSVHSVVDPVRTLTGTVRRAEKKQDAIPVKSFGRDEVGELATALARWHDRTMSSLAEAEESREALRKESQAINRHLASLQAISDASTAQTSLEPVLMETLSRVRDLCRAEAGALRLEHDHQPTSVRDGMDPARTEHLIHAMRDRGALDFTATADLQAPSLRPTKIYTPDGAACGLSMTPLPSLRMTLVTLNPQRLEDDTPQWIISLLRHTAMCASHLLLRDVDRDRREQQALYLHRIMKAQEDERSRVARELHDTVAQDLAALRLEAERLASHAQDDPHLQSELRDFELRSREMLTTVRRILLDLRLSIRESMGFVPAIRWILERMQRESGIKTHLLIDGDEQTELNYDTAITLFRIMQESLLNVAQHARAERVLVTVRLEPDLVEMTVEDDGAGFDPTSARGPDRDSQRGLGILGMEERASLLGGTIEISSTPGEGTTVHVHVPHREPVAPPAPVAS